MASKNSVEVVIRGRNEAKGAFDDFGKDVNSATKLMRTMAGDLVSLLNPALGQFTMSMVHATREAKNLSLGMGTAVIGMTAMGAAVAAAVQSMKAMAAVQADMNIALRNFDAGPIRGQIEGLRKEIEQMKVLEESGFLGRLWAGISKGITGLGGLTGLGQGAPESRLNPARSLYEQTIGPSHAIELAQLAIQIQQGLQQRAALGGPSRIGAQYGAVSEVLGLQEMISEVQRDIAVLRGPQTMGERERQEELHQGRLRIMRGSAGIQREQLRLGQSAYAQQAYFGNLPEETLGFEQISDPTITLAAQAALAAGREGVLKRDIDRMQEQFTKGFELELGGGAEAVGVGPTLPETIKGIEAANKGRVETRDLTKETAEIQATYLGLTKEQQDVWAAQIIQLTLLRDLEAAGADERQKDLANARAAMAELNLEFTKAARENPLAGLTKGFETAARGAGETMQDFAQSTARTMTQTFDDLFFSVFTGRFKDLGKTIANNLLRSVSSAAADLITQPAIRALTSGLQGLRGGLVPTLVAGGTALVPAGSVSAYGGTPGIVAPTMAPGGGVAGGGIFDSIYGYAGAAGSAIGQYFGFGGATSLEGLTAATTAAYGGGFASAAEASEAGVALTAAGTSTAGAVVGTVGAGVGFLASIYGAYQTRSPGYGAATGAVGGLVAGATIGSLYPVVGTLIGSVVGLIAGAALGAGAGALGGKGGHRSVGSERRSAQAVSEAVQNFSATLNQAESGEDILAILNRQWAPNGELVIYATASDGSERNALRGLGFSYKDLFDPAIVESITVAAGVTGTARPSFELPTQALRGKIQQIAGVEAGLLFATTAKGPGVTRTTYEAFAAALQGTPNVGPRNFFFSTDLATNAGASTAQVGSVIRAFLQTNDALDIAPDLTQDRFLNL